MPTIEVSYQDLCELIGRRIEIEELKGLADFAKCEIDAVEGDTLKIEAKDTNRPDLWSTEGIAREIKSRAFKSSFPEYRVKEPEVIVEVDKKVSRIRPYTVCAVVKNLKMTQAFLSQMIQLQEKIATSLGRNRKEVAIGVYDYDKIKSPIKFTTVKPDGVKFIPLDFTEALTPREILEKHPKGKEFGHLLAGKKEYPVFIDARNEVLSLPPIINSEYSGKVVEETKNVFIECSGFNLKFLMPALNVMVTAMADRGGEIYSVKVVYPDKTIITPDLKPKKTFVDVSYVKKITGLDLSLKKICNLLERANYKILKKDNKIELLYPAYRNDIMHQRDVVEDVIISYGYDKIKPEVLKIKTEGKINETELKTEKVAELMTSLGFQEILSYTLTNKENLFKKMNLKEERVAEIENIVSENWSVFRNWLLPSLMDFFSNNKHVEYPQKIFEVGDVILIDEKQETRTRDVRKVAVAIADSVVRYEDIASFLDAFMSLIDVNYKLKRIKHPSFIEGRCADIFVNGKHVGIIGEIHPSVLENWKLDMPVAAFELDLSFI
ncbi:MAG: phenylalanine--tRNA ligase subunit beta [Candidatus Aenigmatarchaeota archaeon]